MDYIGKLSIFDPLLFQDDWFELFSRIEHQSVDLILTDPPYGILEKCRDIDKAVDLAKLEITFDRVLKPTGLITLFCNLDLVRRVLDCFSLFVLRSLHIWNKPTAMPISKLMPLPNAEFLLVLKRKEVKTSDTTWHPREMVPMQDPYRKRSSILESPTRRHIKNPVSHNEDGKRWVSTIISAPNKPNMVKSERSSHPTQKPEALLRMLIRGYSNVGDVILDPFAGSGSSLISAWKESRKSIGAEMDPIFYTEAKERIARALSQQELFIHG